MKKPTSAQKPRTVQLTVDQLSRATGGDAEVINNPLRSGVVVDGTNPLYKV